MDTNRFTIITEDGTEKEMEILFTFEDDTQNGKYVLFTDPSDEEGNVFAGTYNEEGEISVLDPEEDPEEWAMIEEVFGAFVEEFENGEEKKEN